MSDAFESVWKGLFWLLLIVLIGVYVLYSHYADTLKAQIAVTEAGHDPALEARLAEAEETIASLQARLADRDQAIDALRAARDQSVAAADDCVAQSRQAAAEVRAFYDGLADLGARLTDQGILLTLAGDALRFTSGSATLPDGDLTALDPIAELLRERPALGARVEGHTDSSGSAAINRRLSEQRASAVRDALIERGIAGDRLSAEGLGADRPVADNATAAGREANRRVEIWIIEPAAGGASP
jgi:outer membrane protein OmpA-like peptidoglycan-associated protein